MRETLCIPLCARAVETARNRPCCGTRAEEIAASIDYDFGRFDELPSLTGALPRTHLMLSEWAGLVS